MATIKELWEKHGDMVPGSVKLHAIDEFEPNEFFRPYFRSASAIFYGVDDDGNMLFFRDDDYDWQLWQEPKPEPEMHVWWRPVAYWFTKRIRPESLSDWFTSKQCFFTMAGGKDKVRVLEWESKIMPRNREDWPANWDDAEDLRDE